MSAALRYFALVHHENAVRVPGVHKAVRDQDYGLSALHLPDAAKDDLFALHIDVAGRLVENIDRAVMQQRPGKGQPLSLAAGKVLGVFCQLRIQAVRTLQEFIKPALRKDFPKHVIVCLGISHQEVVPDSSFKKIRVAADVSDPSHAALLRALGKVIWSDHDRTALHRAASGEKRCNGRFAAAALAHNAREAVFGDLHVDPVQDLPLSVIGETDALEKKIPAVFRELFRLLFRLF